MTKQSQRQIPKTDDAPITCAANNGVENKAKIHDISGCDARFVCGGRPICPIIRISRRDRPACRVGCRPRISGAGPQRQK